MRSTHTASVEVIAGIFPLDLRFRERNQKFLIKALTYPSPILKQITSGACLRFNLLT